MGLPPAPAQLSLCLSAIRRTVAHTMAGIIKKKEVLTLVELPPRTFGKLSGGKAEDAYSMCRFPARAIPLLHAILLKEGYENVRSINPALSNKTGCLNSGEMERIIASDFLLLSAITRTIQQTEELALQYKERNPGGKVIIGGPHASYLPEECLEWADVVVRKEGDKTLPRLLRAFEENGAPYGVRGVSYRRDGQTVHEEDVEPLTLDEFSDLPLPYYDETTLNHMNLRPVSTSRGCPFKCDYCTVWQLYGTRYRRRSNESILREVEDAQHNPSRFIFFIDDNFSGNPEETKELLRMMIKSGLNKKPFLSQLSIYAAFDADLLYLLKKAGGYSVFLGVESISDETLISLNKKVNVRKNMEAVKLFRKAGLWVNAMMMIGGDGDTEESLKETVRWARDNLDSVQYFTPTPLPGTVFAENLKAENRILTKEYYLYDGQHVVIKPKNFTPYRLQKLIYDMYREFYSIRRILWKLIGSVHPWKKLAIYTFAIIALKATVKNPQTRDYFRRLKAQS